MYNQNLLYIVEENKYLKIIENIKVFGNLGERSRSKEVFLDEMREKKREC